MNILFIAPRFHTNQFQIVKALQQHGHNISFHVYAKGLIEDHSYLEPKILSPCIFSRFLISLFKKNKKIKRKINFPNPVKHFMEVQKDKPNITIVRDPDRLFSLFGAIYAYILGSKIVFYSLIPMHSNFSSWKKFKLRTLVYIFRGSWMTPLFGDNLSYPEKPMRHIYYIPFAVELQNINQTHLKHQFDTHFQLLMTGKYHSSRKNHKLFIDAVDILKKTYPIRAVIIGENTSERDEKALTGIKQYIESKNLSQHISLVINVPFKEMKTWYESSALFILPARDEPAGISVLEAISCGTPSICSTTCGVNSYIRPMKNGHVFTSDDLEDLVRKVALVLSDTTQLSYMRRYCVSFSKKEISSESYYDAFTQMIRQRWENLSI